MNLRIGMTQGTLKVLDETLAPLHPRIRALNDPPSRNRDKARFTLGCLLGFRRLRGKLKANLGHDLRIEQFEDITNRIRMIAVVEPDDNFRKVDGLGTKVV